MHQNTLIEYNHALKFTESGRFYDVHLYSLGYKWTNFLKRKIIKVNGIFDQIRKSKQFSLELVAFNKILMRYRSLFDQKTNVDVLLAFFTHVNVIKLFVFNVDKIWII